MRPESGLARSVVVGLVVGLAGSCGLTDPTESETHFLADCSTVCSTEDGGGCAASLSGDLQCIRGLVTKDCQADVDCSRLSPLAACTAVSTGTPICDVACQTPLDCDLLGARFTCDQGWCRTALGRACVPADEQLPAFGGFAQSEVAIDTEAAGCGDGVCLVNHFQGRVSCPYGQSAEQVLSDPQCALPDSSAFVSVAVDPQLLARRAADAVYCSCRCDGPAGSGGFCSCPYGFVCTPLIESGGVSGSLAGSYCVKSGTVWQSNVAPDACDSLAANCE